MSIILKNTICHDNEIVERIKNKQYNIYIAIFSHKDSSVQVILV